MSRRRRMSATSESRPPSSGAGPLPRLAAGVGAVTVLAGAGAGSPRPAGTATAPPAVVASVAEPARLSSLFLARFRADDSSGIPPETRKITAATTKRTTPDQVLGENTNDCAKFTTADPIRPTSGAEPVRYRASGSSDHAAARIPRRTPRRRQVSQLRTNPTPLSPTQSGNHAMLFQVFTAAPLVPRIAPNAPLRGMRPAVSLFHRRTYWTRLRPLPAGKPGERSATGAGRRPAAR